MRYQDDTRTEMHQSSDLQAAKKQVSIERNSVLFLARPVSAMKIVHPMHSHPSTTGNCTLTTTCKNHEQDNSQHCEY